MGDFSQQVPMPDCPFCGVAYGAAPRVIVDEGSYGEMVHVTCLACGRALAMRVERSPQAVRSVGLLTDCNAEDYRHFWQAERVSLDDVLRVHEGLSR